MSASKTEEPPRESTTDTPDVLEVALKDLRPDNIREVRDEDCAELAESIKAQGVLEPLIVRPTPATVYAQDAKAAAYTIVSGHRRFVGARLAGRDSVPCLVRDLTETATREIQLVENLQRQDLTPLEEGAAFLAYREAAKAEGAEVSQRDLAKKIGKSQSYIAKREGLLGLSVETQEAIREGIVTPAHAEVMLTLKNSPTLQRQAIRLTQKKKLNAEELDRDMAVAKERYEERLKFKARMEDAKVPLCPFPNCGKKATGVSYKGPKYVTCGTVGGHAWDPETGKLHKEDASSAKEEGEKADPEALESEAQKEVEREIKRRAHAPPVAPTSHSPGEIAKALIGHIASGDILAMQVLPGGRDEDDRGSVRVTLRIAGNPTPSEASWTLVAEPFSSGAKGELHANVEAGWSEIEGGYTLDVKKAAEARTKLERWMRRTAPKPTKGKKADAPVLDLTVLEVPADAGEDPQVRDQTRVGVLQSWAETAGAEALLALRAEAVGRKDLLAVVTLDRLLRERHRRI